MNRLIPFLLPLLVLSPLSQAKPTAAAPVTAVSVTANTPEALRDLLSAEGYRPELKPDKDQTKASLSFKYSGQTLYLYFTGCSKTGCELVSIDNGFERPKDGAKVAGVIAAWNAKWFVQAYEDKDGDVYLAAPYMLTGGYVKANFLAWLNYYLDAYNTFSDELY